MFFDFMCSFFLNCYLNIRKYQYNTMIKVKKLWRLWISKKMAWILCLKRPWRDSEVNGSQCHVQHPSTLGKPSGWPKHFGRNFSQQQRETGFRNRYFLISFYGFLTSPWEELMKYIKSNRKKKRKSDINSQVIT